MLFLEAKTNVPVPAPFKPSVTLLARKPPPQLLSRNGPAAGMAGLSLDDDEDSEEERRKKNEADFKERSVRAEKERAEKQRRYAEAATTSPARATSNRPHAFLPLASSMIPRTRPSQGSCYRRTPTGLPPPTARRNRSVSPVGHRPLLEEDEDLRQGESIPAR
jgi:hypothetical protein